MKAVKATEQYLITCTAVILMYNVEHHGPASMICKNATSDFQYCVAQIYLAFSLL